MTDTLLDALVMVNAIIAPLARNDCPISVSNADPVANSDSASGSKSCGQHTKHPLSFTNYFLLSRNRAVAVARLSPQVSRFVEGCYRDQESRTGIRPPPTQHCI